MAASSLPVLSSRRRACVVRMLTIKKLSARSTMRMQYDVEASTAMHAATEASVNTAEYEVEAVTRSSVCSTHILPCVSDMRLPTSAGRQRTHSSSCSPHAQRPALAPRGIVHNGRVWQASHMV